MHRLKLADASFLYGETANAPMHIASLQLLDVPADRRANFCSTVSRHIGARAARIPFMTRRLVNAPFGLDQPIWVTDQNFNIDRHMRKLRLPSPGTFAQLERLVSQIHEKPLDRKHPLWQFCFIEGLEDGRLAWYMKYHHACIDGVAGQQILDVLFSDEPDGTPPLQPPESPVEETPSLAEQWFNATVNLTLEPWMNMTRMAQSLSVSRQLTELLSDPRQAGAYAAQVPQTPFNTSVSRYRSVAFGTLPLQRLRAVGKRCKVSINDVFLAVCAGGLRSYLQAHELLPDSALVAGVPVSLRRPGDDTLENRVSMLLASLATDLEDPLQRIRAIRESTRIGKGVAARLARLPGSDLHIPGMPLMASSLAQFIETMRLADGATPPVNVLISNVPGPRSTRYLCGARMMSHYPVSIASNGTALNITVQSYEDRMDFSATACLEAVPDTDFLVECMHQSWRTLEDAAIPEVHGSNAA